MWLACLLLAGPALGDDPAPESPAPDRLPAVVEDQPEAADETPAGEEPAEEAATPADAPAAETGEEGGEEEMEEKKETDEKAGTWDPPPDALPTGEVDTFFHYELPPPLGFTGRSSIVPTVDPTADFVPVEDRWRIGIPAWDRYDRGHALVDDYPYEAGKWYDPFQQNVLKGDYPIIGQHTFLTITAQTLALLDARQTPVGTSAFESTANPFQEEFFGSPNQAFYIQFFRFSFDLNHGDAAFKPTDWRVKVTPVFNVNSINVDELAFVSPNVLKGVQRNRSFLALEEYFLESKIADLSPDYDFLSVRAGSQFFNSDFKGFLFTDTNRAIRLFGTRNANREQFNLAYFRQAEKDTNSALNTMDDRRQDIWIANYYIQDFIWPGLTLTASAVYNNDGPSRRFDTNSFRARPDNSGVFQPHNVNVGYLGLGLDGHIDRYNITAQAYYALGRDSMNPIGNRAQDIRAGMAAAEISYDRDWARFRTSFFYASGDNNANNEHATGFDAIFDNPNFAGGGFSYWQRQGIGLFGVNLKNRESLLPDLTASKIQGQANFVNPGLLLYNLGIDFDITPALKMINNCNFLWFESTNVLETFLFDGNIGTRIGTDLSTGFEYRPLVSNNVQFTLGMSMLIPGAGFKALYNKKEASVDPQLAAFFQTILQY